MTAPAGQDTAPAVARPWVWVVVPAHDEGPVIGRCLTRLLDGAPAGVHVVVVVNGSGDDTAERVRAAAASVVARGHTVRCEVVPAIGKIGALRHGLGLVGDGPVVLLDADVDLAGSALADIVGALQSRQDAVVAVPSVHLDTTGCPALVRGWVTVWLALPYAREHLVGSGVVAVSAAGVPIVRGIPDVTNDDAWIRRRFPASARVPVDAAFTVHAPRSVRALVARRARVQLGNAQLSASQGTDAAGTGLGDVLRLARGGDVTVGAVAAFLTVTVAARGLAAWRRVTGRTATWSADRSTRVEESS